MKDYKEIMLEGILSKTALLYVANLFRMPFKDWKAYKLGIIDENGNIIKKPVTKDEKNSLNGITKIILKVKKVLVKYIGDSKIMNFLIAGYILKEDYKDKQTKKIIMEMESVLTEDEKNEFKNIFM